MLQNLSERQRLLLMVVAAVLVVALFYLFVLSKQISAFQEAGAALEATSAELRQYQAKAVRLEAEKEKEAASQAHLKELARLLETDLRSGAALVMLGLKALEDEVFIARLRPGEVTERSTHLVLPVELEFWSTYAGSISFLGYLENLGNLAHVKSLNIEQYFGGSDLLTVFEHNLEPVVRTRAVLDFYSIPDARQELYSGVLRIQEWSQGRGTRAFQYPGGLFGKVSPHYEVRMGGEVPLLYLVTLPEPEEESEEEAAESVVPAGEPPVAAPAPEVPSAPPVSEPETSDE